MENTLNAYQKRSFEYVGIWQTAGMKLKVYTIGHSSWPNDKTEALSLAKSYLMKNLPDKVAEEGGSNDLGFVVAHFGDKNIWLLSHWWAYGEICCQMLAHSSQPYNQFKNVDHRPLHACVWEHKVIDHEHRAWVESMLVLAPDETAYLTNTLKNGAY